jgi:hypothetical protein
MAGLGRVPGNQVSSSLFIVNHTSSVIILYLISTAGQNYPISLIYSIFALNLSSLDQSIF